MCQPRIFAETIGLIVGDSPFIYNGCLTLAAASLIGKGVHGRRRGATFLSLSLSCVQICKQRASEVRKH